jgi:hypothetical protein
MLKRQHSLVAGALLAVGVLMAPAPSRAAGLTQTTAERLREKQAEERERQREAEAEARERAREARADAREREQEQQEAARERQRAQQERQREQEEAARERQQAQQERQREQEQAARERQRDAQERAREREREARERSHERKGRDGKWVVVDGERTVQTFRVGDAGSLHVNNLAGDIRVNGSAGSEIQVETIKHARGSNESEARQQLAYVDSSYQKVGNRVEIETTHRRNSRAWVDYTINVPTGTSVELRTVSGDIRVSNVKGEVRAETVSGDLAATALARAVSLKSVSGDVEATSLTADGELTLSSVSGDVVAKGVKGRSAAVGTVSGDVALASCTFGHASVESVSGSIAYGGRLERSGRYELKTHSGAITLASSEGFELDASTFSGSLRSDVPLVTRGGDANFERDRGPGRWVKAVASGGGAFVEIKTFSGDIVLTKAQ